MNLFKLDFKTYRYKGYVIDCYRRTPTKLLWNVYGTNHSFDTLKAAKQFIDSDNI